jgi:alpha-tubulin suppressor-like RCC1 family protein
MNRISDSQHDRRSPGVPIRRRRPKVLAAAVTALLTLAAVTTACQTNQQMWAPCAPPADGDPFGADATYVLMCRNGRWEPLMTIQEYLRIRRGEWVILAPLPQPPADDPPPPAEPPPPPPPPPPPKVVEISAGASHTCARYDDGTAKCWGKSQYGRLGSAGGDTFTPRTVGLTGIAQISAGGEHTCAVRSDTTLWCWGINSVGQLGNLLDYGTQSSHAAPLQVMVGAAPLSGVVQVSAGSNSTCAVTQTNRVWCFGSNTNGQLGSNATLGNPNGTAVPTQVAGLLDASEVSTTVTHTCARRSDGSVSCWGENTLGQLGDGTTDQRSHPVGVGGLPDSNGVATGMKHSCAVTWNARVQCWGWNFDGQLGNAVGNGNNVPASGPVEIANFTDASQLSSGDTHTCARTTTSRVKCWGDNDYGQMGTITLDGSPNPAPTLVVGLTGAVAVDAGRAHTCALDIQGAVWCWGLNFSGQLGKAANMGTLDGNFFAAKVAGL